MYGVLPLWKPRGLTSHDCVQKVRKIFKTKKVGHTGTLDPEVEGVLTICIGEATKIVQYLTELNKTYIATCTLGIATETEDQTGKIIEQQTVEQFPTKDEINQCLDSFKGEIVQIPPMYSAVRVKGKRLYEYARNNEFVERPKRKVTIYQIELIETLAEEQSFRFKTTCSSGTYIRTLCVDIGKALGFPAHMSHLLRIENSNFSKEETITFDELYEAEKNNELHNTLYSIDRALSHLDTTNVDEETMKKISNGQKLPKPEESFKTSLVKMVYNGEVLALYKQDTKELDKIRPERVFNL